MRYLSAAGKHAKTPERIPFRHFRSPAPNSSLWICIRRACRILSGVFALQLLLLASVPAGCPGFSRNAAAAEEEGSGPSVSAKAYCVLDADSGEVVAAANERERLAPASITKILTALVVLEHTEDLDVPAAFSESSLEDLAVLSSTLSPMPRPGEVMTVRDLLYGMIMRSGNECANLLAELTAGSCEAFAGMMNERAARAGKGRGLSSRFTATSSAPTSGGNGPN